MGGMNDVPISEIFELPWQLVNRLSVTCWGSRSTWITPTEARIDLLDKTTCLSNALCWKPIYARHPAHHLLQTPMSATNAR